MNRTIGVQRLYFITCAIRLSWKHRCHKSFCTDTSWPKFLFTPNLPLRFGFDLTFVAFL